MHITEIDVTNVLGARCVRIQSPHKSILIAGPNGAGKSSVAEAIRQAITGEAERVTLKKEYPALLNEGATAAHVAVTFDTFSASMALPAGTHANQGKVPQHIEYCLDPHRFAALDAKARRSFLFGLMGVKITGAAVKDKLNARGVDAAKADLVLPLLAAGFDSATTEAKAKARDAKAAWRTVTGETYGSQKAEGWAADVPAIEEGGALPDLEALDGSIERLQADLHTARATVQAAQVEAKSRADLAEQAAKVERIQTKLDKDRADLTDWEVHVADAEAKVSGAPATTPLSCPHCGGLVDHRDGALHAHQEPQMVRDEAAMANLPKYREARDLLRRAVANGERDLAVAFSAAKRLQDMGEIKPAPSGSEIAELEQSIAGLKAERQQARAMIEAAAGAKAKAQQAQAATAKAKAAHEDVKAWEAISEALGPDGIPAEFLSAAVHPFNEALHQLAEMAGWPAAEIDADMQILVGGRPYGFRSESERWRADAMLAAAIAKHAGVGFVMLDRFDVLDSKGRTEALYWISDLAAAGTGSLVLGTLKAVPKGLAELGIAGVWVEGGQSAQGVERAAA